MSTEADVWLYDDTLYVSLAIWFVVFSVLNVCRLAMTGLL